MSLRLFMYDLDDKTLQYLAKDLGRDPGRNRQESMTAITNVCKDYNLDENDLKARFAYLTET